tara:strand:+ start:351 stop:713 length:363 start_codon:yes stop_codon:yes gene_type:complete
MNYLEIDPNTGEAIGGVYQKQPNTFSSSYINYRPKSADSFVGCFWNEENETWSEPPSALVSLEEIRTIRDSFLLASDWRVSVSDYPNEDKDQWVAYRQLLRDFPDTYVPVESPSWPTQPS